MLPDGTKSKTIGALYIWDEGEQERIKIGNGNLENTEIIGQKDSVYKRFWRKIGSLLRWYKVNTGQVLRDFKNATKMQQICFLM